MYLAFLSTLFSFAFCYDIKSCGFYPMGENGLTDEILGQSLFPMRLPPSGRFPFDSPEGCADERGEQIKQVDGSYC